MEPVKIALIGTGGGGAVHTAAAMALAREGLALESFFVGLFAHRESFLAKTTRCTG